MTTNPGSEQEQNCRVTKLVLMFSGIFKKIDKKTNKSSIMQYMYMLFA